MRIIDDAQFKKLRDAIRAFGVSVAASGGFEEADVARGLEQFGFIGSRFAATYAKSFSIQATA
jgi:hypothetical protein